MKRIVLILLIMLITGSSAMFAQKVLTLKECYEMATAASAITGEKDSYTEIWQLKDKDLSKGWLPTLDANGSFVYNSSVVDMSDILGSLPVPGIADLIDPLPHKQYKITVDINQVIYDGGAIKNARALEKADLNINQKQTETDLYKLRGQINNYYFNLLLLDRQKELLQNYFELINRRIVSMNSALASGVILRSDIDVLASEKIKLRQQISENETRKTSLMNILSDLTDFEIDDSTKFVLPSPGEELPDELTRPELRILDLRKEQLAATLQVIQSKRMPRAFGFATLGYGNPPGGNFFKDEFAPYYILGAGVKWNIFDWNKVKDEKQVIYIQQGIIENKKIDLSDNLKRLLNSKSAEILSLKSLIESDSELIAIRKRITVAAESQYENGTITATGYMNEMNSEKQALINYEIHKINLAMAEVEYLNISGKEIE
ncbi:MAG: TolC family protein [Bacteroidales bacterium]|jgi:outer membrane protein TolC|nr:TolC family protein [Bacteroidales bacterium]